jgi:hypothetical protein
MQGARAFEKRMTTPPDAPSGAVRKPYSTPRLIRYGDVRDVTLGPSPGTGESGNPLSFRI